MKPMKSNSRISRKAHLVLWISLLSASIFSFNNCGNDVNFGVNTEKSLGSDGAFGDVTEAEPVTPPDVAERLDDINMACANLDLPRQTIKKVVEFVEPTDIPGINPNNLCSFNYDNDPLNDNLNHRDQFYQARLEQTQSFSLPTGAVLCGMSFGSGAEQNMFYDDEMILTFDDIAISSTFNLKSGDNNEDLFFKIPLLDLIVYSWNPFEGASGLKGANWGGGSVGDSYCLGEGSTCSWPKTSELGAVALSFNENVFKSITALSATPKLDHEFKLIITGDNDPVEKMRNGVRTSYDCFHTPISFDVTAEYVIK